MMYHCIDIVFWSSSDPKLFENVSDSHLHELVYHREKCAEESHRGHDDPGGRDDILAAWPGHLLHLHANVVQKLARVGDRAGNLFRQLRAWSALRFIAAHFHRPRGHTSSFQCARCALPKLWQGRRDSNPHTRFWRPES